MRERARHRDRRRRRQLVAGGRRPHRARRQAGRARLGARVRSPTASMSRATQVDARGGRHRARGRRRSAASARCAARTMRRTPPARPAPRWRSALSTRRSSEGLRVVSRPCASHGEVGRKGNVLFVNDSKATNADSAAKALACFADIFWIAGGKPKSRRHHVARRTIFPRIRKAYLIGEAAADFAGTLRGQGAVSRSPARSTARWRWPRAMPQASGAARAGGAAVAGLRVLRPVPNFEVRGDAFRELVQAMLASDFALTLMTSACVNLP